MTRKTQRQWNGMAARGWFGQVPSRYRVKTWAQILEQTRTVKSRARSILIESEIPGIGQFRPAARRAWNKANEIQNRMAVVNAAGGQAR